MQIQMQVMYLYTAHITNDDDACDKVSRQGSEKDLRKTNKLKEAAGKEDIKTVYNISRKLSGLTSTMTTQLKTILEAC